MELSENFHTNLVHKIHMLSNESAFFFTMRKWRITITNSCGFTFDCRVRQSTIIWNSKLIAPVPDLCVVDYVRAEY